MSDYSLTVAEILEQADRMESALPIKNAACRSKFFFHPHAASKVFLFLHGFTAGPYQFAPMGQALFNAGYNVLVPLQPGHGQAGDWNADHPPPLPTDPQVYQQFAVKWLNLAQTLGRQVVVGGLSTGATLAAWLALAYPHQIERTLLFAPYLSSNLVLDWFVKVLPIYFEWFNKDAPGNFGYKGFCIPALRLFLEMGQEVIERSQANPISPILMVCSESDDVTSRTEQQTLFETVVQHQPQSWYYCFDQELDIGHRMTTAMEDNDHEGLIITLAKSYVESDLTWSQLHNIAHWMLKGENFEAIVREMNLDSRISPDLSELMAQSRQIDHFKYLALPMDV